MGSLRFCHTPSVAAVRVFLSSRVPVGACLFFSQPRPHGCLRREGLTACKKENPLPGKSGCAAGKLPFFLRYFIAHIGKCTAPVGGYTAHDLSITFLAHKNNFVSPCVLFLSRYGICSSAFCPLLPLVSDTGRMPLFFVFFLNKYKKNGLLLSVFVF